MFRNLRAISIAFRCGAAMALMAVPGAAQAAQYLFSVNNGQWTFKLDSSPVVDSFGSTGFQVAAGPATFEGTPYVTMGISFPNTRFLGGLTIFGDHFFDGSGPVLWSGTNTAPTFNLGSYGLIFGQSLVISEVSAIPEPASWALLIGGFGMIGAAMRRQAGRQTVTAG